MSWLQRRRERKCARVGHRFERAPIGPVVIVGDWCRRCRREFPMRVPDDFDPIAHVNGNGLVSPPPLQEEHLSGGKGMSYLRVGEGPITMGGPLPPAKGAQSGRQCCRRCHNEQA